MMDTNSTTREIISFLKTLILFVVLAFLLRVSVIEPYKIPSGSMIPTLEIGDHILVNKLSYGIRLPKGIGWPFYIKDFMAVQYGFPKRKDIVVFTKPDDPSTEQDEEGINIIKRVIGLPGETVEVRGTAVYINGKKLDEPYAIWRRGGEGGDFGPVTVPAGKIFLLGDNRDESRDSRFWKYPFLDVKRVKGRAFIIYWSWYDYHRIGTILR